MEYIDIHTHLAWGVDDGFQSKDECEKALIKMQEDHVLKVIATPHYVPGQLDKEILKTMKEQIFELKKMAASYGIEVYEGCELFLNFEYLEALEQGYFQTLANSKYLLCEFDVRKNIDDNEDVEDVLYEILVRGYIPVIAHVERYFHKGVDIQRVKEWVYMGCKIQVNRISVLDKARSMNQKNALKLIEANLVHFIASDAHQLHGKRICQLSDVYAYIKKAYGKENADILMYKNPMHVIQNETLEDTHIQIKSGIWSKLWRK